MNKLIIIGAGGHGKVIADIAIKNGYTEICYLDDEATGECMGFPIIGKSSDVDHLDDGNTDFIIGIGNNRSRMLIAEKYHVNWITLVHPSAQIGTHVSIGEGSVVMAGAVINVCSTIGAHCIINTNSVVEHDNILADFVHISPGVTLSGTVTVGRGTWIGTGSSVINNVDVCEDVTIGVGSVVIRSVKNKGTYWGIISQ